MSRRFKALKKTFLKVKSILKGFAFEITIWLKGRGSD
jgi:hypothetical protein